jgi:hypothetical protein
MRISKVFFFFKACIYYTPFVVQILKIQIMHLGFIALIFIEKRKKERKKERRSLYGNI